MAVLPNLHQDLADHTSSGLHTDHELGRRHLDWPAMAAWQYFRILIKISLTTWRSTSESREKLGQESQHRGHINAQAVLRSAIHSLSNHTYMTSSIISPTALVDGVDIGIVSGSQVQPVPSDELVARIDALAKQITPGSVCVVLATGCDLNSYIAHLAVFCARAVSLTIAAEDADRLLPVAIEVVGVEYIIDTAHNIRPCSSILPTKRPRLDGLFSIILSSGTTAAKPKMIPISRDRWEAETNIGGPKDGSRLCIFVFGHPSWYMSLFSFYRGVFGKGKLVFGGEDKTWIENIAIIKPSSLFLPPSVWDLVYQDFQHELRLRGDHCRSLLRDEFIARLGSPSSVSTGSATVSKEVLDFIKFLFPHAYNGYGLTETGHLMRDGKPHKWVTLKLTKEGELCVKSPYLVAGYFGDDERTQKSFKDGWFHTGDSFELQDDGRYRFLRRAGNMIKTPQGIFVDLEEVEDKVCQLPDVEHAVLLVTDKSLHLMVLVRSHGRLAELAEEQAFLHRCAELSAARVHVVSDQDWPRFLTSSGKLARHKAFEFYRPMLFDSKSALEKPMEHESNEAWLQRICQGLAVTVPCVSATLAQCGMTSMASVSLIMAIRRQFPASNISFATVMELSVAQLAAKLDDVQPVVDSNNRQQVAPESVADADADLLLQDIAKPWIQFPHLSMAPEPANRSGILLTGATGFVGIHILHQLVTERKGPIFCLVRTIDAKEGRRRLEHTANTYGLRLDCSRVNIVRGDLLSQFCGISEADQQRLVHEAATIIHVAAMVNWRRTYAEMRVPNVLGSHFLMSLAKHGGMRFCHTSTIGALTNYMKEQGQLGAVFWRGDAASANFTKEIPMVPSDILVGDEPILDDNGYCQTKWVNEKLLERGDIDSVVCRLGFIGWNSANGRGNDQDFIVRLVKSVMELQCVPVVGEMDGISLTSVENTAAQMIACALQTDKPRRPGVATYNIDDGDILYYRRLFRLLDQATTAKQQSLHVSKTDFSEVVSNRPDCSVFPLLPTLVNQWPRPIVLENRSTLQVLQRMGLPKPTPISDDALLRHIVWCQQAPVDPEPAQN